MNVFQVTLRNIKRPEVAKIIDVEAHNREQAAMLSERAGFRVALVKPIPMGDRKLKGKKNISRKELVKMFRALASMLRANISTADALMYYAQGLPDALLQGSLMSIRNRLEAGMPVHIAFAKERKFDTTIITMIEAGADAGKLHEAFTSMARKIKVEMAFSSKLRNALLVPCLVILFQIGLFIWSQISVVAQVEDTLKSIKQEPDALSKVIFSFSHVVRATWPFFIIALTAFIVGLFRSPNLRQTLLNFGMEKWRLLKKLVMGLRQTAYIGTLQMLYANGINLARASMLAAKVVQGTPTYAPLVEASQIYEGSGLPFAEALKKRPILDPQVMHMISIGERSASLPEQLEMLRDIYEEDTAQVMSDFTQIINVITLMCAMFLIGLVFAGAMLPIMLMGPKMMQSGM
ncbi:type II secretory pathway component PulF [Roseimicrobium gellanilyticum]|uniref:Type II secretory pathway component PulF n=1 Tax=Roseimicrobium gellanilyticum TaxID=748857 RepID=A0A366H3G0_9BACT|nr:type II secretion system F family protein [Roseimicrobium gellanilyticum]RBP36382.1 type II secretory pathway component PulF [Roseimicrobium gellanilyticum]